MSDKSEIFEELERRVAEAHVYLRIDQAREELTQLESRASSPDLWDDQDEARKITGRLANIRDDIDRWEKVRSELDDAAILEVLAREENDESVEYEDDTVATIDQMSKDVTAFLAWASEPEMEERKRLGFIVMSFLIIFVLLMYFTTRRLWSEVH